MCVHADSKNSPKIRNTLAMRGLTGGRTSLNNCCAHLRAFCEEFARTFTDVGGSFRLIFYSSQTASQTNSSSLLTDVGAHSSPTFTDLRAFCEESARTFADVGGSFRLFFDCFIDLIPHRCSPTSVHIPHRPSQTFTDIA